MCSVGRIKISKALTTQQPVTTINISNLNTIVQRYILYLPTIDYQKWDYNFETVILIKNTYQKNKNIITYTARYIYIFCFAFLNLSSCHPCANFALAFSSQETYFPKFNVFLHNNVAKINYFSITFLSNG